MEWAEEWGTLDATKTTIGTCSICGGRVQIPAIWNGIIPPTATCSACGAVGIDDFGTVIPMRPPSIRTRIVTDTSGAATLEMRVESQDNGA